jgi:beta-fructofuranosidase
MPTRRKVLAGAALAGAAALTRSLPALAITDAEIARDPMRPRCHLLPVRGWMNDPCGPIYWKSRYHMFFQYNPDAAVWGDMHWNHAVSPDMVHWQRLPIALAPTPGSADQDGCFTGTAVVANGKPSLLYTGVQKVAPEQATLRDGNSNLRESQCLAIAADDTLRTWRKLPAPVIAAPPPGMQVTGFRDPSPWRQGETWYCVIASGQRGVGGSVLLYRSADLRTWEYLHPLAAGKWGGKTGPNPVDTGEMWECPDFFPLDGKHVLIHSTEGQTLWQSGTLDTAAMLFHAEQQGILDHGTYYAPKTQLDARGGPHPVGMDPGVASTGGVQCRRLGGIDVAAAQPIPAGWPARHAACGAGRLAAARAARRCCCLPAAHCRAGAAAHPGAGLGRSAVRAVLHR